MVAGSLKRACAACDAIHITFAVYDRIRRRSVLMTGLVLVIKDAVLWLWGHEHQLEIYDKVVALARKQRESIGFRLLFFA